MAPTETVVETLAEAEPGPGDYKNDKATIQLEDGASGPGKGTIKVKINEKRNFTCPMYKQALCTTKRNPKIKKIDVCAKKCRKSKKCAAWTWFFPDIHRSIGGGGCATCRYEKKKKKVRTEYGLVSGLKECKPDMVLVDEKLYEPACPMYEQTFCSNKSATVFIPHHEKNMTLKECAFSCWKKGPKKCAAYAWHGPRSRDPGCSTCEVFSHNKNVGWDVRGAITGLRGCRPDPLEVDYDYKRSTGGDYSDTPDTPDITPDSNEDSNEDSSNEEKVPDIKVVYKVVDKAVDKEVDKVKENGTKKGDHRESGRDYLDFSGKLGKVCGCGISNSRKSRNRIISGSETKENEFP